MYYFETKEGWIGKIELKKFLSLNFYNNFLSEIKDLPESHVVLEFLAKYRQHLDSIGTSDDMPLYMPGGVVGRKADAYCSKSSAGIDDAKLFFDEYDKFVFFCDVLIIKNKLDSYVAQTAFSYKEKNIKNKIDLIPASAPVLQTLEAYIEKSTFAIFAEIDGTEGYLSKSGKLVEISSAELFDTKNAAIKRIKSRDIENFDIVPLKVSLQHCAPQLQKMQEAVALIEKRQMDAEIKGIERSSVRKL